MKNSLCNKCINEDDENEGNNRGKSNGILLYGLAQLLTHILCHTMGGSPPLLAALW